MPAALAVLLGVCIALPFVALKSHLECWCAMVKEPCAHMKAFFELDSPRTATNLDRFDDLDLSAEAMPSFVVTVLNVTEDQDR